MVDIRFSHFFDRPAVIGKLKGGTRAALSKIGAYVRRTAKGLLRSGNKPAKPGNPPHSHVGLLRDRIFFAYDDASESVVIGPQLLNSSRARRGVNSVPELLEHGGTVPAASTKGAPLTYRKFPYMAPAEQMNRDKHAQMFRDIVK